MTITKRKKKKKKLLICFETAYKVIKIKNEVTKNVNEWSYLESWEKEPLDRYWEKKSSFSQVRK